MTDLRIEELVPFEDKVERGKVVKIAKEIVKAGYDVAAYLRGRSPIDVCTVNGERLVTDGNHTVAACFILGLEAAPCRVDQYCPQPTYPRSVQGALKAGHKGFARLPVVALRSRPNQVLGTLEALRTKLAEEAGHRDQ